MISTVYTGWSVYKNTWEGISLAQLLKQAGVKPEAHSVKFYSGDGVYTDAHYDGSSTNGGYYGRCHA